MYTAVHSVEITEIYFHIFWQKFRELNVFSKAITKELISRNIFSFKENFSIFHTVLWSERMGLCLQYCMNIQFFKFSKAKHIAQICALELHNMFMLYVTISLFQKS